MRKPSLAQAVYNATFPHPRASDPGSFAAHITRNLVPEVRIETNTFYGPLDSIEAQYPGLNYSYGPHRMRLSRFTWHRRLFHVFDKLRLTETEIAELCCWEGRSLRDGDMKPRKGLQYETQQPVGDHTVRASESRSSLSMSSNRRPEFEEYYSDDEMESCGVALNQRLLDAMAARDQGADVPLDEDWEQWLKEAGERGGYGDMVHAIRSSQPLSFLPEAPTSSIRHNDPYYTSSRAATLPAEQYLFAFPQTPTRRTHGTAR
ncbi:hypothetical protein N7450_008187 [Penicillium hetheringtonii]|uniref:Uncharacterized protein n=1 Tax=Penicillium hetheringtonii TaxID=911720 RepID=A0AAD6GRQ0_9EURO|nr:hypothetical protein N7450_008187 [Penicillium hetheringtonii]